MFQLALSARLEGNVFSEKHRVRDTVLLSGWLFADLLLGVAIIFFVSLPGKQQPPVLIRKWSVSSNSLDPTNSQCTGGLVAPACTIQLSETADSQDSIHWNTSSDMTSPTGSAPVFSPSSGILEPGKSVSVALSSFPCQNGSFTFNAAEGILPISVAWHCTPKQQRLNFNYKEFMLNVQDTTALLNNSPAAINDIEQQVRKVPYLQGGSVGIAIVYDGAPTSNDIGQAQTIDSKIYAILGMLGKQGFAFQKSSYYVPLFNLYQPANLVKVDVYLFQTT